MDDALHRLVAGLHHAPYQYVLALTGGGTSAAAWLLSVPGGSRTVLEVAVPYGEQSLAHFLGNPVASSCSADTGHAMARRAFERAAWLAPTVTVAGVGLTASLRSDRPKRGDHRFHLTVHAGQRVTTQSLTLSKDARTREAEEDIVSRVLLNAMAGSFGIAERVDVPLLAGEEIVTATTVPPDDRTRFLAGELPAVCVNMDGSCYADVAPPTLLLCGSFNPLHEGHVQMLATAARVTGKGGAFELAVTNAEKGALPDAEIRRRSAQFAWRAPLWLTHEATFAGKAELFPGATFLVGADTAARIVQPRFYKDCPVRMAEALARFRARGCRLLVAGRVNAEGNFVGLEGLALPQEYRDLFLGISEQDFRLDLSSTELRSRV